MTKRQYRPSCADETATPPTCPGVSASDYIELVDFTDRELHPGKRGKIAASEPKALPKLGLDKNHWVKGRSDPNDKLSAYLLFRRIGFLNRLWLLASDWGIGRIDRQSQGNQPTRTVWHWFCADFEQNLGRHWVIFNAAFAAGCVGF